MALYTTMGTNNIPEGAVKLSREEALQFQKKMLRKWKSLSDVQVSNLRQLITTLIHNSQIFLEYGWAVSSATTFASSYYITGLIRSLLNTGRHGKFIPYIATTFVPSVLSGFITEKGITEKLLLMTSECPMCMQLKFCVAQEITGVFIPTITSLAMYLPLANLHKTIALPDISHDTRKAYKFCFNLLKSSALKFQVIAALQIPLVFLLPYLEAKQLNNIHEILRNETVSELE